MKITIQGQDYSSVLDAVRPLSIERKLNKPSVCSLWLCIPRQSELTVPTRNQSLRVTGDDGTLYFTGYVNGNPAPAYAGLAFDGPAFRMEVSALSDETLLDQAGMAASKGAAGETAGSLMAALIKRTGQTLSSPSGISSPCGPSGQSAVLDAAVNDFVPAPGATWSECAAAIAGQARGVYRAIDGTLMLSAIPSVVHALREIDGTLDLGSLNLNAGGKRTFANDVTVCGTHEPTAYVTEYFVGDGVTTEFHLATSPWLPAASERTIVREFFDEPSLDKRVWSVMGGDNSFSLAGGGLAMRGGDGVDGNIALSWVDQIEMGGTLLVEATGVMLAPGSSGILASLFSSGATQLACTAGFQVNAQQGTGAVSIQPLVQGSAQGVSYVINSANQYALRLRVHCGEIQRLQAIYRSSVDSGPIECGGGSNAAGANLHFEIQEFVNGVAGMPVTLYDGAIAALPATCALVAASSTNLQGNMRAINLTNCGSAWVTSSPANGMSFTRRMGSAVQAAECTVEGAGRLVFYTGYAPAVGETVAVSYRAVDRAVGRAVDEASQQALSAAGMPSTSAWVGSVTSPAARSSRDCRNAALALAQTAINANALWSGSYRSTSVALSSDVWPGDALQITAASARLNAAMIVRAVKLTYASTYPDLAEYEITFANDWAEDLAIETSSKVPADAWLAAAPNATPLSSLNALAVTAIAGNSVTIDVGVSPPSGGGFEIRRRDFSFQPSQDSELVLRGSQTVLTFMRTSASDRFYIRMFDGANPPNYSEFSAALIFNLPLT